MMWSAPSLVPVFLSWTSRLTSCCRPLRTFFCRATPGFAEGVVSWPGAFLVRLSAGILTQPPLRTCLRSVAPSGRSLGAGNWLPDAFSSDFTPARR